VTSPQIGSGAAAATRPPLHDVAHLGHIELLTPKMCESLWFFVEVLGMTETCREGPFGARVSDVAVSDANDDGSAGFTAKPTL